MGNRGRSQNVRLKYAFIKGHRREFDTAVMCRLLEVSRSGFYQWLRNPLSDRALEDHLLVTEPLQRHVAFDLLVDMPRRVHELTPASD